MNDPCFLHDSYRSQLRTRITGAGTHDGRPFVVLEDTVFYPEGGGQPADRGTIDDVAVVDVQKADGEIRHFLERPLDPGPAVLNLDWARRWDHMQQHTAQHLLTAVAQRDFGWRTTAFHLGPEVSDIELDVPSLDREALVRLENACLQEILAARPIRYRTAQVGDFEDLGVRSRRLPEGFEGAVRLVEIEGLDLNTCGGTHLRSTAEIGLLGLLGTEPMRGGTRLHFAAGDRVRRRLARHEDRNAALRSLLDTGDDELVDILKVRLAREKELARKCRRLVEDLADTISGLLAGSPEAIVDAHWDDRDMPFLQRIARTLVENAPHKAGLLTASDSGGAVFVVFAGSDSGVDLAKTGPGIAAALGGRGGGRPPIFQGKAESLQRRNEAAAMLRT